MPASVVDASLAGAAPDFAQEDEAVVHQFTIELLNQRAVTPTTWERAQAVLGSHAVIELVGVLGYYALISMTIKAIEIGVVPGADETFG